jgi:hypothetical protein
MHQQRWLANALLLLVLAVAAAAAAAPEPVNAGTNSTSPTEKLPPYVKVMLAFDGECDQQVASATVYSPPARHHTNPLSLPPHQRNRKGHMLRCYQEQNLGMLAHLHCKPFPFTR